MSDDALSSAEEQGENEEQGSDVTETVQHSAGDAEPQEEVEPQEATESGVEAELEAEARPRPRPTAPMQAETAFETFAASWVPPWARSLPELVVEPAADYSPEEMGVGRFVYGDAEDLPNPDEFEPGMGDDQLRGAIEAILLVVDTPVSPTVLAQVLEEPTNRIEATLATLYQEYAQPGRGIDLRQVAGGWRLYTRGEYASYVERFVLDGQQIRLTQAALETLAVVAYKQPVSRSRVAAIRGVNCDGVIKTLVTRGLVEECGTEETGAHLYRTTKLFLEKLGINSVEDLPSLAPFLPENLDEFDVAQL
jgi:segregation and condensation protein B